MSFGAPLVYIADVSSGGGGVTAITFDNGLTASPNPITGTGTAGLAEVAYRTVMANVNELGEVDIPRPVTMTDLIDNTVGFEVGAIICRADDPTGWTTLGVGPEGTQITGHGPGGTPSYLNWAESSAQANIDMDGNDIKGPARTTAQNMTIALPDIQVGSNVPSGTLTIGGDTNYSEGGAYNGSTLNLKAGSTQHLVRPGNINLMAGTNPDDFWGDIHVSCYNMIFDIAANLNMGAQGTITVNSISASANDGVSPPSDLNINAGSTNNAGQGGASAYIRSGSCTATGTPGNIYLQPSNNGAGLQGSTYLNGTTVGLVSGGSETLGQIIVGLGSATIANSVMVTGTQTGSTAPVAFVTGTTGQFLGVTGDGSSPPSMQDVPTITNGFYFYSTAIITDSADLPASGIRRSGMVVVCEGTVIDPVSGQYMGGVATMWVWNATISLWIPTNTPAIQYLSGTNFTTSDWIDAGGGNSQVNIPNIPAHGPQYWAVTDWTVRQTFTPPDGTGIALQDAPAGTIVAELTTAHTRSGFQITCPTASIFNGTISFYGIKYFDLNG